MPQFVHLHVHSEYSTMQGTSTLEALCLAAKRQGATAVALTDTNGLYGAIRFIDVAYEHGLCPILDTELFHQSHLALCLIKDRFGYSNLCHLPSQLQCHPSFDLIKAVRKHSLGFIIASDDLQELFAWKRQSKIDLYIKLVLLIFID